MSQSQPLASAALPLGDLLALGNQLRTDDAPDQLLHEVAEALRRIVASPQVYVSLRNMDTDALEALAFAGVDADQEQQLRAEVLPPSVYQELLRPERRIGEAFLLPAAETGDAALLLVPLRGRAERLIGLVFISLPPNTTVLEPAVLSVIAALTRQAALAVENVRLAERSARLLAKEQLLAALGRDVSSTLDLHCILEHTVSRLHDALGSGALALLDASGSVELVAAAPSQAHLLGRRWSRTEGMLGWVVAHGQPFFANDVAATPELQPPDGTMGAWIIAPLRSGGQVIGMILVSSAQAHAFTYGDVDLVEAIAAQVGGPITSARLYEQAQQLAAQVQQRADQLAVLNRIARTTSALLDQEAIVAAATQQIRMGFGFPQVDLFWFDEERNELVLGASDGSYPTVALGYRQHINLGLMGRAARTQQLLYAPDAPAEADYLALAERQATRSELVVPITTGERLLGLLNVEAGACDAFSSEDANILTTIADMLAGALENVRLYRRAQAAAVLEERNRLARELHDSVTQQLFSMTLTAQAARAQLERNPQRVAGQLERLQETATAALAEMRALIFQLRPPALRDQGLIAALQQHAQLLAQREGIKIGLSVIGDERLARGIEQPIFRIVQEALNNVCKHAAACNVQITLELTNDTIIVRVCDDGAGFDPEATPTSIGRQLGLLGMRERAAELGGSMDLNSAPGSGTEVVVRVPRP